MKTHKYHGALIRNYTAGMLHAGLLVAGGLLAGLLAIMIW